MRSGGARRREPLSGERDGGLSAQVAADGFNAPEASAAALCDFGSARSGGLDCGARALASAEDFVERATTLAYRAPELCDLRGAAGGVVGPPVDVWAAGVALFKLAFLRLPF